MKKDILFIATIENFILAFQMPFIKYLQEKGFTVHVATNLGDRRREFLNENITCHDVNFSRSAFSFKNILALFQLIKLIKGNNFKLIHVHTPMGAFLGRLANMLTKRRPIIYTVHGLHFYKGAPLLNWLIYYPIEKISSFWTDEIITINKEDYNFFKKSMLKKKISFVHGVGLKLDKYSYSDIEQNIILKNEIGLKKNETVIINVAELNNNKNQIQLIKAIKLLIKYENNVKLLIVGNGAMKDKLIKLVETLELKNHVKFLGERTDIPQLLSISNIFILTSKREGLPRCIMEAMAAEKPIVATDIRGSRDLIKNEVNGLLVPVNDYTMTSEAILKLIRSKYLANNYVLESKKKILNYSIDNVLNEMDKIYMNYL